MKVPWVGVEPTLGGLKVHCPTFSGQKAQCFSYWQCRNAVVSREELIKSTEVVEKIIPAGAMASFQGLKYLDSVPR